MARDLYAQSSGNANAINWNTKGDGSGTTVAGSALAVDDSLYANLKSVTIAANLSVAALYANAGPQAGTPGGSYILKDGCTLTAPLITADPSNAAVQTPLVVCNDASGVFTIVATTISAGNAAGTNAILANGTGATLIISGNLTASGISNATSALAITGAFNSFTLTGSPQTGNAGINVAVGATSTNNCTINGSIEQTNGIGAKLSAVCNLIVTGNANSSAGIAIQTTAASNVTVNGSVTGTGAGNAVNISAGTLTIAGSVQAGTTGTGVNMTGGNLIVGGNVTAGTGIASNGVRASAAGNITIGGNATGGSQIAGTGAYGIGVTSASAVVRVGFAVGGNGHFNNVGVLVSLASTNVVITGGIKYGANGQSPTAGEVLFSNAAGNNSTVPPNVLQNGTRVGPYPVTVVGGVTRIGPYPVSQFNP